MKLTTILVLVLLTIFLSFNASAFICYSNGQEAERFYQNICAPQLDGRFASACYGYGYACPITGHPNEYEFYCDLINGPAGYYPCPNGCDATTGTCKGLPTKPDCLEGYSQCGNTETYDRDGDVYKCVGGELVKQQDCTVGCTETATRATCNFAYYFYCPDNLGTCNTFRESNSPTPPSGCALSKNACESQLQICCVDQDAQTAVLRLGSFDNACQGNEQPFHKFPDKYTAESCREQLNAISDCPPVWAIGQTTIIPNLTCPVGDFWDSIKWYVIIAVVILLFLYLAPLINTFAKFTR